LGERASRLFSATRDKGNRFMFVSLTKALLRLTNQIPYKFFTHIWAGSLLYR
jgi:hypothetical protein